MKGASQECYIAADGLAAGQTADGLIDYRLENGGSQILSGGAFIDQGLNIRLGKYTAAGGDGVDGLIILGVFI